MLKRFLIAACFCFTAAGAFAAAGSGNGVIYAYYFHGSFRCPTCHKLEQYSKEAIESKFKRELEAGKLVYKTVNVEARGNEHFVDDYKLFTKALVIVLVRDGKDVRSKNLEKIWEYMGDQRKFHDYVSGEVANFLKEL